MRVIFYNARLVTVSRRDKKSSWKKGTWGWQENACVFTSCYALVTLREGMLKRNGCVYTQIVKHCSAKELLPIIGDFAELGESEIYSDSWKKAYDGLVDFLLC